MFSSKCCCGHNQRKFGHTANFLAKSPKKFSSKSRKVGKKLFFRKNIFFLSRRYFGPYRMRFWKTILKNFFFKMSKIDKVGHRASGNNSAKCSFGCVICSLENAVKKCLPNSESFSLKVWKGQKNFLSLKLCFPRKIIFVFLECKIGKQAKNITPTVQKLMLQVRRKWKKETLIEKGFFTRRTSGMIECSFDKRPLFSQKVWKWQNESSNFRRKFQKLFLWTANMPLWERR